MHVHQARVHCMSEDGLNVHWDRAGPADREVVYLALISLLALFQKCTRGLLPTNRLIITLERIAHRLLNAILIEDHHTGHLLKANLFQPAICGVQ